MFGQNPKRAAIFNDGTSLEIKSIFKTIQGEGPFVGMPAVFIRLGGCNLACNFCDTEFEDFNILTINSIIEEIKKLTINIRPLRKLAYAEGFEGDAERRTTAYSNVCEDSSTASLSKLPAEVEFPKRSIKLVVITGGEPFRQPIELLCHKLIDLDYLVQIETNGTLYRDLPDKVHIICSPKATKNGATKNGYSLLRDDLLSRINALKFLVAKNIPEYSNIPEVGQSKYNIPVFIQPMDQNNPLLNKENEQLAIDLALKYGYRLSIQIHKILGIE
ncbi:palindromic element RPE1 domain-containing protein [Candidatus Tisiphia endosymbiont of Sialis lutaria]|uniref:palindromic element RPE1 domain-containing protein n=1 Tax=Candidatus Tisiphia endosymbiont of Sialis lutaria TaxID=2029164 RepID=UPI00312CA020